MKMIESRKERRHPARKLTLDYPKPGEIVTASHYSFRAQDGGHGRVEISVDRGEWKACRNSVGYWWFDWTGAPGEHFVSARVLDDAGQVEATTSPRRFIAA